MADAKLNIGVDVELQPGPVTVAWLESLGWIRPEGEGRSEDVLSELEPDDDEEYDPRPAELVDLDEHPDTWKPTDPKLIRGVRTGGVYRGKAMGGAEAMRYKAARLRRDLMSEVSSPERVDEMLRMCDVDPDRLPDPDCDC